MNNTRTLIAFDILAAICSFLTAFWVRLFFAQDTTGDLVSHAAMLPMILALELFFLTHYSAYDAPYKVTVAEFTWAALKSIALTIGLFLAIIFVLKIQYISRFVIVFFAISDFIALVGIRLLIRWHVRRTIKQGKSYKYVLIIGAGARAKKLYKELRKNEEYGLNIVGCLDIDANRIGTKVKGASVIGTVDEIHAVLKNNLVDEVILAVPQSMFDEVENIVHACEEEGIKIRIMVDFYDLEVARISLQTVGSIPLLCMEPVALNETKLLIKRSLDIALTVLSLPVVLPIMAVIALAIKLDSRGPVFFLQERVGLKKRQFKMIKFRSMICGAEKMLKEIEHLNEAEGPIFKMANDPRVTRVGRFLRKTSLDELPQLFNVLRGEMSLVGPRPMSLRDVNLFDRGIQRKRFSVKPGLTSLWAVSGRSKLSFSEWVKLDLEYISNWSLFLDISILVRTLPVVLKGSGAH